MSALSTHGSFAELQSRADANQSDSSTEEMSLAYRIGLILFFFLIAFDVKDRGFIENYNVIRFVIVASSILGFCIAFFSARPILSTKKMIRV